MTMMIPAMIIMTLTIWRWQSLWVQRRWWCQWWCVFAVLYVCDLDIISKWTCVMSMCLCKQLGRQWCERGRQRQGNWCSPCQNQPQVLSADRSCTCPSHVYLHICHHHFNATFFSPFVYSLSGHKFHRLLFACLSVKTIENERREMVCGCGVERRWLTKWHAIGVSDVAT